MIVLLSIKEPRLESFARGSTGSSLRIFLLVSLQQVDDESPSSRYNCGSLDWFECQVHAEAEALPTY